MGQTDLAGTLSVAKQEKRDKLSGKLRSKRLDLDDLTGFVGGEPGPEAPQATADTENQTENKDAGYVIPNAKVNLEKLRLANISLDYVAQEVSTSILPINSISTTVELNNGNLSVRPLRLGLGGGLADLQVEAKAANDPLQLEIKGAFRDVALKSLLKKWRITENAAGVVHGELDLAGQGMTTREILGTH